MNGNSVFACEDCGSLFESAEDFDLHHEQKGHKAAVMLKPLLIAEFEGIGKQLALFTRE